MIFIYTRGTAQIKTEPEWDKGYENPDMRMNLEPDIDDGKYHESNRPSRPYY